MAAGYRTFREALDAAQKIADKYDYAVPIWKTGRGSRTFKFAHSGRYGVGRPFYYVQPKPKTNGGTDND